MNDVNIVSDNNKYYILPEQKDKPIKIILENQWDTHFDENTNEMIASKKISLEELLIMIRNGEIDEEQLEIISKEILKALEISTSKNEDANYEPLAFTEENIVNYCEYMKNK